MQNINSRSVRAKDEASDQTPRTMRKPFEGSIGFIGLGHMGSAMAANLVTGGATVRGYVRKPARNADLKALGIEPTNEMVDLFGCDIVITMVSDDAAAHEIVFGAGSPAGEGLASGLKPGALHISMSTISPSCLQRSRMNMRGEAKIMWRRPYSEIQTPLKRVSFTSSRPGNPTRSSASDLSSTFSVSGPS